MKQYKEMVQAIKERGVYKPAAREGMPGTTSLFGYQFRHNLADGFPALTTKQLYWKGVVIELLWFLSGDTNIKFLDQHGVRKMWHEDAYNYYKKIASRNTDSSWNAIYMAINEKGEREDWTDQTKATSFSIFTFDEFCQIIQDNTLEKLKQFYSSHDYTLGDCGMQYGKLWRGWESWRVRQGEIKKNQPDLNINIYEDSAHKISTDQIKELIEGLKKNPMGRRHIITAWNPATLDDMALNACHAMAQWNCRPLTNEQRLKNLLHHMENDRLDYVFSMSMNDKRWEKEAVILSRLELRELISNKSVTCNDNLKTTLSITDKLTTSLLDFQDIGPKYYLDCQMYQRSADVFLGVPLNIASYALLTEILCKICNMVPGEMIYTYGDVHIYDDHQEAINEQLSREERDLPTLKIVDEGNDWAAIKNLDFNLINMLNETDFVLENYNPHPSIKGKLSTGLQ